MAHKHRIAGAIAGLSQSLDRNQVTNPIGDAVALGRIKRKDSGSGKKFAEYVPYWA